MPSARVARSPSRHCGGSAGLLMLKRNAIRVAFGTRSFSSWTRFG